MTLQVAYNGEKAVRLFELPSFASRGFLVPVSTVGWKGFHRVKGVIRPTNAIS